MSPSFAAPPVLTAVLAQLVLYKLPLPFTNPRSQCLFKPLPQTLLIVFSFPRF